jgi:hypothetical protein
VRERKNLLPLAGTIVMANKGLKIRCHLIIATVNNIMQVKELPLQNLGISNNRSKIGRRDGKAKHVVIHQIICSNSDWRMMVVAAILKAYKIVLQIIINNSSSRLLTLSQQITHPVPLSKPYEHVLYVSVHCPEHNSVKEIGLLYTRVWPQVQSVGLVV